jgi:hypothetical protein
MPRLKLSAPSPALVIAIIALVVAVGGTALAQSGGPVDHAAKRHKHHKKKTTTAGDNRADTTLVGTLAPNLTVAAARNATHSSTADNATHSSTADNATNATNATHAGNSDNLGGTPAASYQQLGGTLPSGKTETGDWGAGLTTASNSDLFYAITSFPIPLAAAVDAAHAIVVPGASATSCAGVGQADPGYVCVYVNTTNNATAPTSSNIFNPEVSFASHGTAPRGFGILLHSVSGGSVSLVSGSYAVTAP